jgi:amidase
MAATVTISSGATWQEVAADRQKHRDATISALEPPLPVINNVPLNTISLAKQVLSADEIKITETKVEDLVVQLANGEISCVTVTKAFLRRAGLAQKAVCLPPFLIQISR